MNTFRKILVGRSIRKYLEATGLTLSAVSCRLWNLIAVTNSEVKRKLVRVYYRNFFINVPIIIATYINQTEEIGSVTDFKLCMKYFTMNTNKKTSNLRVEQK